MWVRLRIWLILNTAASAEAHRFSRIKSVNENGKSIRNGGFEQIHRRSLVLVMRLVLPERIDEWVFRWCIRHWPQSLPIRSTFDTWMLLRVRCDVEFPVTLSNCWRTVDLVRLLIRSISNVDVQSPDGRIGIKKNKKIKSIAQHNVDVISVDEYGMTWSQFISNSIEFLCAFFSRLNVMIATVAIDGNYQTCDDTMWSNNFRNQWKIGKQKFYKYS